LNWIKCADKLPEAVYGREGDAPHISEDILTFFASGDSNYDVCNYDHETGEWTMVNKNFAWADCDPTHWQPLEPPKDGE
jgi:Protein of unknown function (DUF551)